MKGQCKRLVGQVTSAKTNTTAVVAVQRTTRHPLYGKVIRRTRKYMAHNANNAAHEGDMVRIVESRPLSATKRWVIEEILEHVSE